MSNTSMEYKLGSLTKIMSRTLKNWSTKGGQPVLPDVAAAVRAWKQDMEILSYHDDINGPAFQKARQKMEEAWDVRDDRDAAIESMGEALSALEDIPDEMKSPVFTKSYKSRDLNQLWGEDLARYDHDPHVFSELYSVKRQLSGFSDTPSPSMIDDINVRRVKAEIAEIAERYDDGNPIGTLGRRAVKSIDLARRSTRSVRQMRRHFSEAIKAVDEMGIQADLYHSPVGYKATLSDGVDDAGYAVERMQDLMYTLPFYDPATFMVKAQILADEVIETIRPFYDPKALRLANSVKSLLIEADNQTKNAKVKSLGYDGWQCGAVQDPFNEAVNRLDELSVHIQNL